MSGVYAFSGDDPIFDVTNGEDYFVFRLVGNPIKHSYESKHHEYNRLYKLLGESHEPQLLFDFSSCCVMDSITIGILIDLTHRCRDLGGNAVAAAVADDLQQSFVNLMLLQPNNRRAMWELYPSVEDAVADHPW